MMTTIKYTFVAFTACMLLLLQCALAASTLALDSKLQTPDSRPQTPDSGLKRRVLLIPLDDRPPCLQFPVMIGNIGDTEVVTPPREMLGRFTVPGDTKRIAGWLRSQNLRSFDAIVVSVDMLAYGGLVNSRVHRTTLPEALKQLEVLRVLHRWAPKLPIYGFNVIMRLAPTADGRNEAYRDKLSRWAEISPEAQKDAALAQEVARLKRDIPAAALSDYKRARARNFAVNQASVEMVRSGIFDYLILSQDDAKPRGVHVADRERLIAKARQLNLSHRVAVQPGADEVAMLLLARALNKRFQYTPRIAAIYSSESTRNNVAPFEDRPLHRTVSFHIVATGSRELQNITEADILFYVYGSRAEAGIAVQFAEQIAREVERGRRVIVADIDYKGDVQGADPKFTEEMHRRNVFPRLVGYASWNTAGNTIGTALPHGIIYALASEKLADRSSLRNEHIASAQMKFLIHRLVDDYIYHSLVRPEAKAFAAANKLNPNNLVGEDQARVENFIRERMSAHVDRLSKDFVENPFVVAVGARNLSSAISFDALSNFRMSLPWGRTFEAEIDFDIKHRRPVTK